MIAVRSDSHHDMTNPLYFAHANSFPASVYRKMLTPLGATHTVHGLDCVGHDPAFPVTDCWPHLVGETLAAIERVADRPVRAVGHSLGGVLILYAAVRRPELFESLVILDAPLFSPWRARAIRLAKLVGLIDRLTPGGNTLRRRDCWASVAMVDAYYRRKPQFAAFDDDCLRDYAEFGTCDDGAGGRRLKFRPQVEHAIYRTLPHDIDRCAGRLTVPACYLAATRRPVLRAAELGGYVAARLGMAVERVPGSHLFPLEYPLETAARILDACARMAPDA